MPSVRCPSCERLLNVRDEMVGQEARCPLCGTVFPAEPEGGRVLNYQPLPSAPDPSRPWRPPGSGRREDDVPRYPGPRRDATEPPSSPLRLAGNWLFGLAVVALVWNMSCGCAGAMMLAPSGMRDVDGFIVVCLLMLQLVAEFVVLVAAQSVRTGARGRTLCWTGVVLALGEGPFALGRFVAAVWALESGRVEDAAALFNGVSTLVSLALFIAGLAAMRVLNGPDGKPVVERED